MRDRPDRRFAPAPGDMPRLFVAVPIPSAVADQIGEIVDEVRSALGQRGSRVRWVQMEGLHVTLRFLGPTPPTGVERVAAVVDRCAPVIPGPFELHFGGAGTFPVAARPRALWLGIRVGAAALGQLSDALTRELVADGWSLEDRAFRPHLTIARTDGVHAGAEAGDLLIARAAEVDLGFMAERITLYRSHLGHGPARYEVLHSTTLG